MGFIQSSSFSSNSTLFFIFFFILTSSQAQGESNWKLIHKDIQIERRNLLIGSRPPRCEKGYCRNCGHCEAVQVPISPRFIRTTHQALARSIVDSRGDDISNYKPMCWKCKCGDFMFNP
ncbi:hypothetical protein L6452_06007 [Arctium lappa]|uniref:Uncharacterized protein n=1 Tax=Arctium lappa TaxID=4217 RepID=A0ACB9EHP6_ARCLA|nr:hypothetical protein L6452_06007 [Arctium lappa]